MKIVLAGTADSTNATYGRRQRNFLSHCASEGVCPLPASELTLLNYCSDLLSAGLSHSTISGHLSAISHLHTINGFDDPQAGRRRLSLFKRGVSVNSNPPVLRAPVTTRDLSAMLPFLDLSKFEDITFFAMATTAFFAFLRISELTYPKTGFSPSSCLTSSDLTWSSDRVSLFLKQSKADRKREGVSIMVGRSPTPVCAHKALLLYLAHRERVAPSLDPATSALFVTPNGVPVSHKSFVTRLNSLAGQVGVTGNVTSHSLRIGAASSAWRSGFTDTQIMKLGRWKSDSFMRYIREDEDTMTSLNAALGQMWHLNLK